MERILIDDIKNIEGVLDIDILSYNNDRKSVLKQLERLTKEGYLKRIEKGVYYVPKKLKYGESILSSDEFIKKYLVKGNERIGYIPGNNLFNRHNLATQISNEIKIATNIKKNTREYNGIKISFVYNKAPINKNNIEYLEKLDILKNIKNIQDSNIKETYEIMKNLILKYNSKELKELLELSEKYYTVGVTSLLCSMIEERNIARVNTIKNKLNKNTVFNLNLNMPNGKEWGIK